MGGRTLLDENVAAFIQSGVSMTIASRNGRNTPAMARATGCRVSRGRDKVTVLVSSTQGAALLDAIRATGAIAVVFSQPSTHRTVQLKGNDAEVIPLKPQDGQVRKRYIELFAADIEPLGYSYAFTEALVWCEPEDLAEISFTPASAFNQTPGPNAGAPLHEKA